MYPPNHDDDALIERAARAYYRRSPGAMFHSACHSHVKDGPTQYTATVYVASGHRLLATYRVNLQTDRMSRVR